MKVLSTHNRGFSLIELVIVVIIIGILGAIAIPRLSRGTEGARINAFVSEINNLAAVIEQYRVESQEIPADSATGVTPTELKDYLHDKAWEGQTPIGGNWDIEANGVGSVALAVGVHFQSGGADETELTEIDGVIDDGDLTTGVFQKLAANRYYLILEN